MNYRFQFSRPIANDTDVNLHRFLRRGERDAPLVFEGRQEIRRGIAQLVQLRRETEVSEQINSTEVIQGAPGAGKTSLLNQIGKERTSPDTTIVQMAGENFSDSVRIAEAFYRGYGKKPANISRSSTRVHRTSGTVGILRQEETWESVRPSVLADLREGVDVWSLIASVLKPPKDHVFLCLVDEAQRTPSRNGVNPDVTSLHDNKTNGLKIATVFGGLCDTVEALNRCGLSRLASKPISLGPLSEAEAIDVVRKTVQHEELGLADAFSRIDLDAIAAHLAVASEGWPRHLHHYIKGLIQQLSIDVSRSPPEGVVDLERVLDYGHQERANYYDGRFVGFSLRNFVNILIDVARQFPSQSSFTANLFRNVSERHGKFDLELLSTALDEAVHTGVLEREYAAVERYRFPIPSLTTFLQCQAEHEQFLHEMREKHVTQMTQRT